MALTEAALVSQLEPVLDPELGLSVVGLGLIYAASFDEAVGVARVRMTLSSPTCPLTDVFKADITRRLKEFPEVQEVNLEFTFTPPWSPKKATAEVKEQLALMGLPLTR